MLDKNHRQYSCAYWKEGTNTLEEAQQNKIDHIIKKLDIKPGQKILEVGCGWGGMAFEISKQKGCEITGISLSKNQINYCKKKSKELGLDNQVQFQLVDYRELKGKFDRIYSVGMFEHVGKKFYKTFFKSMNKLLKEDGVFLLHTIGSVEAPTAPNKFINKYIFPGGVIPSFSDIINPIQKTGLIVADTETLIRHYDKTLESWLERFMEKRSAVKDLFGERFVKMWEFYLSSCSAAFRYRDLVVFQLQIVKNFQSAQRTRDYIYS
jgi:cyclopropane-fatty-acyl-phospholipid synthase